MHDAAGLLGCDLPVHAEWAVGFRGQNRHLSVVELVATEEDRVVVDFAVAGEESTDYVVAAAAGVHEVANGAQVPAEEVSVA